MRKNFKLILQYDGTRYNGWQKQGNTDNTIQGKLETLLSRLLNQAVEVTGSGRTDAGVHAMGQVASFHVETDLTAQALMNEINEYLPKDIGVIACEEADARFHARLNAKQKTYRYRVLTGNIPNVFEEKYMTPHPDTPDVEAMRHAARALIGEHDFAAFCDVKKTRKSTVRTIYDINIQQNGNEITLDFTGNGFLYHMVRLLTGTLLEIGEGKRTPEDMQAILTGLDRSQSAPPAPAKGLTLMHVGF